MGTKTLSKSIKARTEERAPKINFHPFLLWQKSVNYFYQSDVEDITSPTVRITVMAEYSRPVQGSKEAQGQPGWVSLTARLLLTPPWSLIHFRLINQIREQTSRLEQIYYRCPKLSVLLLQGFCSLTRLYTLVKESLGCCSWNWVHFLLSTHLQLHTPSHSRSANSP